MASPEKITIEKLWQQVWPQTKGLSTFKAWSIKSYNGEEDHDNNNIFLTNQKWLKIERKKIIMTILLYLSVLSKLCFFRLWGSLFIRKVLLTFLFSFRAFPLVGIASLFSFIFELFESTFHYLFEKLKLVKHLLTNMGDYPGQIEHVAAYTTPGLSFYNLK
jgi:hypothetical protein